MSHIIRALAIVQALVYAVYLALSPFLAAVYPYYIPKGPEGMGLWLITLPGLPEGIVSLARGDGPFGDAVAFITTYGSLLFISTALWVAGLIVLARYRDAIEEIHTRAIVRWTIVFVAVLTLATPVIAQDLWLTVVWGRMVAAGSNPYYLDPTAMADLPYRGRNPGHATYGPLSTLISGFLTVLTGGNALAIVALQKLLVAGCWVAVIRTVHSLVRDRNHFGQCAALMVVGWAPLALIHAIADGHNDPLMVLPMLLWLLWLERGRAVSAGVALGLSMSIKYVTAPLLALQAAHGFTGSKSDRRATWLSLAAALTISAALLAVFYRSPTLFDSTRDMRSWRFLTPATVVGDVARNFGVSYSWLMPAVDFAVVTAAAIAAVAWLRRRSREGFRAAVLWTIAGVMLGLLGHVWPWFLLWLLPLAAIQPRRRIAWFVFGMTAAAPFFTIPWSALEGIDESASSARLGLLVYLTAIGAMLFTGRTSRWVNAGAADER